MKSRVSRYQTRKILFGMEPLFVFVQAIGRGSLGSLADGRAVIRRSFEVRTYEPHQHEGWTEPYQRFLGMIG